MSADESENRAERIRDLFLRALQMDDVHRDAWLSEQCGDDHALKEEVHELLRHGRTEDDLLEKGVGERLADLIVNQPDKLRCPHCQESIEVIGTAKHDPLTCESCGRSFTPASARDTTFITPENAASLQSPRIGPYKILQRIGLGGQGEVFLAEQTVPVKRRVALKLINTNSPTKDVLGRFESERQALAIMDHNHIAKVLDAGTTEDGRPYFAMELVKGIQITEYCDKNKLTPDERLELFVQTCRAIQHAHAKGIVHRDLKPSNILVTLYDGKPVVKVIDFGLAKALHDTTQLTERTRFTQHGQVVGTLAYMSPEQAEMNALDVDTRTDVYSLGVIIYELLAGSTPLIDQRIRGQAFDRVLALIREEEAVPPSQRLSDSGKAIAGISRQRKTEPKRLTTMLKGDLDWIAIKALEKDRSRRYDTPAALADDVQRYLDGEAIEARPPSFAYRTCKAFHRYRAEFITAGAFVVTLAIGLAGTATMWHQNSKLASENARRTEQAVAAKSRESDAKLESDKRRKEAEFARDRLEETLASSDYELAVARWESNRARDAQFLLHRIPRKYRDFEWYLARNQFRGSDVTCYGHTGTINDVEFSPDGKTIASASDDQTIKFWDSASGAEAKTLVGHKNDVIDIEFTPDGKMLGSLTWRSARLWDLTPDDPKIEVQYMINARSMQFGPDGQRVIFRGREWFGEWSLDTRQLKSVNDSELSKGGDALSGIRISDDGKRLVISKPGVFNSSIRVWDIANRRETLKRVMKGSIRYADFIPGSNLVAALSDGYIYLIDSQSGIGRNRFSIGRQYNSFTVSPDGNRIAAYGTDANIAIWDLDGRHEMTLSGHLDAVHCAVFSLDGMRLASGSIDKTVKIWDLTSGENSRVLESRDTRELAFFPGGDRFVAAGVGGVRVYDANTGEEFNRLHAQKYQVEAVAISPDGTRIISGGVDSAVRVWDASTGKLLHTLKGHGLKNDEFVTSLDFSPDGTRILSGGSDKLLLWDSFTGEIVKDNTTWSISDAEFSPGGEWFVSASGRKLTLWDADSGDEVEVLREKTERFQSFTCIAFSADGNWLASGDNLGAIEIWNTSPWQHQRTLHGHLGAINDVQFNRSGSRIASAGKDHTIRIWNALSGDELRTLHDHNDEATSVCFSPDNSRIVSGSLDGTVKIWEAETDSECEFLTVSLDDRPIPEDETSRLIDEPATEFSDVGFNTEGTRIFASSGDRRFAWSVDSGEMLPNANVEPIIKGNRHGRWLAIDSGEAIMLVDTRYKNTAREKCYRTFKREPNPRWHGNRVETAVRASEWYTALFHVAWIDKYVPDYKGGPYNFALLSSNLQASGVTQLPLVARSGLEFRSKKLQYERHDDSSGVFTIPFDSVEECIDAIAWHMRPYEATFVETDETPTVALTFGPHNERKWAYTTSANESDESEATLRMQDDNYLRVNHSDFPGPDENVLNVSIWELRPEVNRLNDEVWHKVARSRPAGSNPWVTEKEIETFRQYCLECPAGYLLNTLAVAEYRLKNYEAAIEAARESLERMPLETGDSDPHPINLAILAMAYKRMANDAQANDFRAKFDDAMQSTPHNENDDCQLFSMELDEEFPR